MNQKTAYEQIITGKLQALPVPDMADAIWARIEAQLDLDMPQTDPPPTNPPGTPSGGIILGGISIVFVIALITYLFFKKETNNQPTTSQPANTTNTTLQKGKETFLPPNGETGLKGEKATLPPATVVLPPAPSDSNTVSLMPSPVILNNDSTTGTLPIAIAPPVTTPQKQDTVLPVKKGRGVPGLKDDDYKIVPKKDSGSNN